MEENEKWKANVATPRSDDPSTSAGPGPSSSSAALQGTAPSVPAPFPSLSAAKVKRRCAVIVEGDPKPGAGTTGRLSFQSFNPLTDKLRSDLKEEETVRKRIRDLGKDGREITDEELAILLPGVKKQRREDEDDVLKPLRGKMGSGKPGKDQGRTGDPGRQGRGGRK